MRHPLTEALLEHARAGLAVVAGEPGEATIQALDRYGLAWSVVRALDRAPEVTATWTVSTEDLAELRRLNAETERLAVAGIVADAAALRSTGPSGGAALRAGESRFSPTSRAPTSDGRTEPGPA